MIGRTLAVLVGVAGAVWILSSVVRTVAIPRPERVWLTTTSFELARRAAKRIANRLPSQHRHSLLGAFAPTVLVSLPLLWSIGMIGSFASIYWGLGVGSARDSLELSGSSLTTLGLVGAPDFVTHLLVVSQAVIGLAIVALMIAFLPTLYGAFSRREVAVGRLTTRAGSPPAPVPFISRLHTIDRLDVIGQRWEEWEDWFVELGETHTTFPALIYFRSAHPDRSWITAAETALDTAAIVCAIELVKRTGQADTMIRSGYLALRSIADFYRIEPELPAHAHHELSVSQDEFNAVLGDLEAAGIVINANRQTAWEAFAGWRINYDRAITGLRDRVGFVPSHWGQDSEEPST